MSSPGATAFDPGVGPLFKALLRADFLVTMRNRRAVLLSVLLPILLLFATNTDKAERRLDGSTFIVGLCITYGLVSTSIMGYALTVARDREKGVFQRLRVTPAPTWTIMASRLVMQVAANFAHRDRRRRRRCPDPPSLAVGW